MRSRSNSIIFLFLCTALPAAAIAQDVATGPRTRKFSLVYAANVGALPPVAQVDVWLPVPSTSDAQQVRMIAKSLPAKGSLHTETTYGNRVLYLRTTSPANGSLSLKAKFSVTRSEVRAPQALDASDGDKDESRLPEHSRRQHLRPDALVPIDGKPLDLLGDLNLSDDPWLLGRQLYDRVADHMTYKKDGTGWGKGDVLWACDSRYGNCTDFHSLFISLARSRGLPARFEIGYALPSERGKGKIAGYHCWAFFFIDGRGWAPVDISEADKTPELADYYYGNLTENRVSFTAGRDLVLEPPQQGPPLNYFIDPYVEVDGKPWPQENIRLEVFYADE